MPNPAKTPFDDATGRLIGSLKDLPRKPAKRAPARPATQAATRPLKRRNAG